MEFIFNGRVYSQRTPNSKFVCLDLDGNILEKYTPETLPYEVYTEYTYIKMQSEFPERFFRLKDGMRTGTREITGIAHKVHNLIIPAFIGEYAIYDIEYEFNQIEDLEFISFPDNFRRYPAAMLSSAPNLIKVYVGDNCEIGKGAFANKERLREVRIPNTLTSLEDSVFYNCKNLSKVNLENITEFCNNACSHCEKLDFTINKETVRIGTKAFFKSGITHVNLTGTIIESAAFAMCDKLVKVNVESEKVSENAFIDCKNLK